MKHYQLIRCPDCDGENVCKNGHSRNKTQRYLCQNEECPTKSFQLDYKYNAHKRGIKEQIEEQTLNSSGVRDISRNLNISQKTVTEHLKKKNLKKSIPIF